MHWSDSQPPERAGRRLALRRGQCTEWGNLPGVEAQIAPGSHLCGSDNEGVNSKKPPLLPAARHRQGSRGRGLANGSSSFVAAPESGTSIEPAHAADHATAPSTRQKPIQIRMRMITPQLSRKDPESSRSAPLKAHCDDTAPRLLSSRAPRPRPSATRPAATFKADCIALDP